MTETAKNLERDKKDARELGAFFKEIRGKSSLSFLLGVALSGYINGFNDAERCIKTTAQPA